MFRAIAQIFYPARCAYCGDLLPRRHTCCPSCAKQLHILSDTCPYCGYAKADCRCKKRKRAYRALSVPFYYQGLPAHAVRALKFYQQGDAAREMALRISDKAAVDFATVSFDWVTGVPMTKRRERERGFNQSLRLAKEVGLRLSIPFHPRLLVKIFDTSAQHTLHARQRRGNVIGAFDVKQPELVADKTILLVDDVMTTGATLEECAKTLRAYGAAAVYCAVFTVTKYEKQQKKKE